MKNMIINCKRTLQKLQKGNNLCLFLTDMQMKKNISHNIDLLKFHYNHRMKIKKKSVKIQNL